jgi:hypothetical protein
VQEQEGRHPPYSGCPHHEVAGRVELQELSVVEQVVVHVAAQAKVSMVDF